MIMVVSRENGGEDNSDSGGCDKGSDEVSMSIHDNDSIDHNQNYLIN